MIAERYLAKRFRQGKREGMAGKREGMAQGKREGMALGKREGKREGMALGITGKREGMALGITEVLDALDEDRHAEVRRRLRRKGYADFLPADE
jgi:flagellar biosynthesis/type III secretory pathway protein FliH